MLNWDEPLTPQTPRAPEPVLEAPVVDAETATIPLAPETPKKEVRSDRVSEPTPMPANSFFFRPASSSNSAMVATMR